MPQLEQLGAQVGGDRAGVGLRALRGVGRGHARRRSPGPRRARRRPAAPRAPSRSLPRGRTPRARSRSSRRSRAGRCAARRRPPPPAPSTSATEPPTSARLSPAPRRSARTGRRARVAPRSRRTAVRWRGSRSRAAATAPGFDRAERERLLELRARAPRSRPPGRSPRCGRRRRARPGRRPRCRRAPQRGCRAPAGRASARARAPLPAVVGRRREVHDHLGAGEGLVGGGRPGLPDVLADREPDRHAVQLEGRRLGPRLEVALLVEDAVVRQVHLAVDRRDLPVGEHRRGVVDVVGPLGEADEGDDAPARSRRAPRSAARRRAEEVGLQQQVLGRVAGERELGEHHELRALVACAADEVRDHARRCRRCRPTVGFICASATRMGCGLMREVCPLVLAALPGARRLRARRWPACRLGELAGVRS